MRPYKNILTMETTKKTDKNQKCKIEVSEESVEAI